MKKISIENILNHCLKNKKVLTPSRRLILKVLAKHKKPQSAYSLRNEINKNRKILINISTIYRVLDFWIKLGFIHKIASINKYLICLRPDEKHVHMLNYCTKCEKVIESCSEKMNLDFEKSTARLDLAFNKNKAIEIPVICPSCS